MFLLFYDFSPHDSIHRNLSTFKQHNKFTFHINIIMQEIVNFKNFLLSQNILKQEHQACIKVSVLLSKKHFQFHCRIVPSHPIFNSHN